MKIAIALLVCVGMKAQTGNIQVLSEVDDGKSVNALLVVGNAGSSYNAMRQTALDFLRKYSNKRTIVDLVLAPDAESVLGAANREGLNGLGYAKSVRDLKSKGAAIGPVGRLFWRFPSASFMYRSGEDLRRDLVVGTVDPSITVVDGRSCEILHTRLTSVSLPHEEKKVIYSFNLFVRSSPVLSLREAAELVRSAENWTNNSTTTFVTIRPDVRFFDDFRYPELLPWLKIDALPTQAEYEHADEIRCFGREGKITCNGQAIKP